VEAVQTIRSFSANGIRPLDVLKLHASYLRVHSATASVQELRPSALRSELAYRALRVLDSSPLAGSGSLSKNFFSWQRGYAATGEQRTFEAVGSWSG
jgi:hypothetical protein